jgi:hypothetical protein
MVKITLRPLYPRKSTSVPTEEEARRPYSLSRRFGEDKKALSLPKL